ncbi:WD repeat-containing protein 70, putative [Plasmodium vinckei brucechwatti]|uniref:WD repeat-containing protein 70, putative n=1 Tax=Plasmodium vinckei brucechwatti TaxID=119398 RepID=A0A6V7RX11_PLAVN|nr:WD repeat-containing protein 70, putative [Plasmodium vinckei brucechwatti]
MNEEDVVGDSEYSNEFSDDDGSNEFKSDNESEKKSNKSVEENSNSEDANNNEKNGIKEENIFFNMKKETININNKHICNTKIMNNGNSLIISGNDHNVRIYEFKNMNKYEKNYTKLISLSENSIVNSLDINNNFILLGYGYKCYVYNMKCELIKNTIRGDMYITDVNKTKGHMRQINCCKFHPNNNNIFISGSLDSTLRIWDLKNEKNTYGIDNELVHNQCLKILNEKNIMNNNVLCCDFTKDGNTILIGCENGQLDIRNKISNDYMYSYRSDYNMSSGNKKGLCHKNSIIDILTSKKMDYYFFTRSLDETIKYWDRRNLQTPINTIENVDTFISKSNMSFYGTGEKYLAIGTQRKKTKNKINNRNNNNDKTVGSRKEKLNIDKEETWVNENNDNINNFENMIDLEERENKEDEIKKAKMKKYTMGNYIKVYKGEDDINKYLSEMASFDNKINKNIEGTLKIYDIASCNFNMVYNEIYEDCGIISTYYDDTIKQLFLGSTNGNCIIYYDDNSRNGVLQYINKEVNVTKSVDNSFYVNTENIFNMDNIPEDIHITESGKVIIKKKNKRVKMNPTIGMHTSNAYEKKRHIDPYSKYIVNTKDGKNPYEDKDNEIKNMDEEEDDIVDILRKRELNKKDNDYFLKAYQYTQPNKVIDYSSGDEQEYSKFLTMPKCPRCGIKNCVCGYMKGKGKK